MEHILWIINEKNVSAFNEYLTKCDDVNEYLIVDCEENTKLNLLHILAGIKPPESRDFILECIRHLINRVGLDINFRGVIDHNFGITAAHIAVQEQNVEVLQLLIDFSADMLIVDSNGQNVQDYALKVDNLQIVEMIEAAIQKWYLAHLHHYNSILGYPRTHNSHSFSSCKTQDASVTSRHSSPEHFLQNERSPQQLDNRQMTFTQTPPRNSPTRQHWSSESRSHSEKPNESMTRTYDNNYQPYPKQQSYSGCCGGSALQQEDNTGILTTNANENSTSVEEHWAKSGDSYQEAPTCNQRFTNFNSNNDNPNDWTCGNATDDGTKNDPTEENNFAHYHYSNYGSTNKLDTSKEQNDSGDNLVDNHQEQQQENDDELAENSLTHHQYDWTKNDGNNHEYNLNEAHHEATNYSQETNICTKSPTKLKCDISDSIVHRDEQSNLNMEETSANVDKLNEETDKNQSGNRNFDCRQNDNCRNHGNLYRYGQGVIPLQNNSTCSFMRTPNKYQKAEQTESSTSRRPFSSMEPIAENSNDRRSLLKNSSKEENNEKGYASTSTIDLDLTPSPPMPPCQPTKFTKSKTNRNLFGTPSSQRQTTIPLSPRPFSTASNVSYQPSGNTSFDSQATEVYVYKDDSFDVELIEERYDGAPQLICEQRKAEANRSREKSANDLSNHSNQSSFNRSTDSVESTIDDLILKMSNTQLYSHLKERGERPGPITDVTRSLYNKKAHRILKQQNGPETVSPTNGKSFGTPSKYSVMEAILDEINGQKSDKEDCGDDAEEERLYMKLSNYPLEFTNLVKKRFPFEEAIHYETLLMKEFDHDASFSDSSFKATASAKNTYFTYLLLDPLITENLPERANLSLERMIVNFGTSSGCRGGLLELLDPKLFAFFILAIFYVGKGHNARAYQHFYDAFKAMFPDLNVRHSRRSAKMTAKNERICSIWRSRKGPISLHCFQGISENEALTREALMIEVLSLSNLTNHISGQYRCEMTLNKRQRNILGTYLLFKAFIILLLNGERQVKMPAK